jgi:hypothetical protein
MVSLRAVGGVYIFYTLLDTLGDVLLAGAPIIDTFSGRRD